MPVFTVVSNGLLVYSGSNYMQAQCIYSKQVKCGRLTILYHHGRIRMQSDTRTA
jgi:hypothetical protein